MGFINYNNNSLSCHIEEFEKIGTFLGVEIDDDEVWEVAREYEDIPYFENIYQNLLLGRIVTEAKDQFSLNLSCFINGLDTHLTNSDIHRSIHTFSDFKELI